MEVDLIGLTAMKLFNSVTNLPIPVESIRSPIIFCSPSTLYCVLVSLKHKCDRVGGGVTATSIFFLFSLDWQ